MSSEPEGSGNTPSSHEEDGAEDDFRLAPIETSTFEENRVRFLRDWYASGERLPRPQAEPVRVQFGLSDLFLVFFGVALAFIGFGGQPSQIRATLLALLLFALMFLPYFVDADSRVWRGLWLVLLTAYAIAAAAILFRILMT